MQDNRQHHSKHMKYHYHGGDKRKINFETENIILTAEYEIFLIDQELVKTLNDEEHLMKIEIFKKQFFFLIWYRYG